MEAIKTVNLCKKYKNNIAVKPLNITVNKGELVALLGTNGAGKTTTVRMLSGLTCPSGGDAWLNGYSVTEEAAEVKQIIGVSPQETAVAPNLTVEENLLFMCGIYGYTGEKGKARTKEYLDRFELCGIADKKACKLSGGWQRRLSIAMAMIGEPEILFLDEPTLGLDVIARTDLWDMIRSLKGKITVVLTTHYMEEAEMLSDRVAIMKDGELLICTTVEEIKKLTGAQRFDEAFIRIIKGEYKCED